MSAYLEEHLPHLTALHAQLALPSSALASDQARIEAAIKDAVASLVRDREAEVERWQINIQQAEKDVQDLEVAVGGKLAAGGRMLNSGNNVSVMCTPGCKLSVQPLPYQHERLLAQKVELEKVGRRVIIRTGIG